MTAANRAAFAAVRRPAQWPFPVFCLTGGARSGLTSVAEAFAAQTGGQLIRAAGAGALRLGQYEPAQGTAIAIDDADRVTDERGLLTLISALMRQGGSLLLTAHSVPAQWHSQSPDLLSRLKSAPLTSLGPPDEEMLRLRLRRACAHFFLVLPPNVEDFLVTRLGLSYERIESTAEALSGAVAGRELTVPLARDLLGEDDRQRGLFDDGDEG